ncbi:BTAD domain-containing putative transcriptional regulator [Mycobacterium senriense]
MELGVLGPLQVRQGGASVVIPGAKPRAILTMLGLHCGSVVPADTLVELLWSQDPPRTAAKALQTHISSLRRTLGDGFVLTQGAGWVLAQSEVDASWYKSAARLGRDAAAAGETSQALARFEEALALWRGIPELPDGRRGTSEKTRWVEGHAALVEDRADALLATGRAAEVIGDLEAAVADAPLRERRWGQLMLALYRAGRQGEALGAYKRARSLLADDLGVDPGPELRRLEAAIVAQDASLDVVVAQQAPSVTRAVTFLLTDIEGSTAAWEADADAMAVALARHDELVEQVVTSRGGRLIKTRGEGDATFSVFDRPSAAAAAAIELQDAITHEPWASQDPIRVRMALHTGEVELRDGDYYGRAVNRVARLRSLAEGGQILCSGATAELVIDSLADDVALTDLGMRQLKNLARPEHVFELRLETGAEQPEAQAPEAPMERPTFPAVLVGPGPFVGRGRELEGLLSAWQTALAGGVRTVLIAGEPGVGKTRLAGEWSQQAYAQGAVVLYGRCDEDLGAPYQPFAEALRSLAPCMGADRLRGLRGVEALLALVPGLADAMPDLARPAHADPDTERYALFDAVVALLQTASKSAPVVLVLDDLHWAAKPTLLLLRHLLRFGEHARVQIIGTYRSTDLDRSHPLAAMLADLHRDGTANRLALGGLDEDEVTAYVAESGYDDEELAHALASVTGGNPFFLIEALRHVDESGGVWDQSTLPQGVREAVSRRLSRLPAETNKALAAAAVAGSRFALELVEQVVGSDLVDAFDEARQAGIVIEEPGGYYRFNHALVRQSLLAELASVRRMRLHQRIATTLETLPGAEDELLAELAHHYFECAWAGNAAKAVFYCRRAADQAMARLAYEGAADLYHHALHALEEIDDELPDRDEQTAELLIARCEALLAAGDVASAAGAVSKLQVATVDSARLAAWATCFDGQLSMLVHPERLDEVEAALGAAAAKLAELDDAAGEAKAHTVRAGCLARLGRIGDCEVALDDALTAARRARDHRRVNAVLAGAPLAALWGPNPVPRAGGRCLDVVRLLRITTDSPAVEATSTRCQAVLEAFRGRAPAARRMIDSARRTVSELGLRHALLEVEQFAGIVELIVDDPAAAEPHLRKAYNGFRRMGLEADTAETAALLGRGCLALDRDDEAGELCAESQRLAGHALKASIAWRTLRAQLLARGDDHDGARRIASEAVALAERTDALVDHGDACLTLATVLSAAGDVAGARAAAEQAVDLYERKGAVALAETARRIIGERTVAPAPAPPEGPVVALDNACARVVCEIDAATDREAWDETERHLANQVTLESRRRVVGFPRIIVSPSQWIRDVVRSARDMGGVRYRHVVLAVRGERLALTRLEIGTADASPGAPEDEMIQLVGLDADGHLALHVWFDVEDMDAAIAELDAAYARLEDERPKPRRLENAATRVYERLHAYFAARDWDAITELLTDDYYGDDRRSVVGAGIRSGPDAAIQDYRSAADIEVTDARSDTVATRGARLALTRARYSRSGSESEAFRVDFLQLVEIDTDERIAAMAAFDLDDFDAALTELDARYLAGEAAPHARTWSVILRAFAAFNAHQLPSATPDWLTLDHRRGRGFSPGDLVPYIHAAWELAPQARIYVEAVHRLSNLGAVVTDVLPGTSPNGFDAEWLEVNLLTVQGDLIDRSELFDEADLDAAIARFEQLGRPAPQLENAASRATERFLTHFAGGDWEAMAEILAEDFSLDDRRRVVGAGVRHGRDAQITDMQAISDLWITDVTPTVIAIRADRHVLMHVRHSNRDQGPAVFHTEALVVGEINADERIVAAVSFDPDHFDAAITELDARYLAGEAAPYAETWSTVAESYAALNRHEQPLTSPDCVNVDHRRETAFGPGDVTAYIHAGWDSQENINIYVEQVHRLSDIGTAITYAAHEVSQEGMTAEWGGIALFAVRGGRINRTEVFDETDIDAAIARFEQLNRPAPRLDNAAARVFERVWSQFAARDWDAMAEKVADNYVGIDHRRIVSADTQHGRDDVIRDLQAAAGVGFTISMVSAMAIRGDRLVLARTRAAGRDPGAAQNDALNVVAIDDDERIARVVSYDLEDIDDAIAELDAQYATGEAAAHARTWSAIARSTVALNRHDPLPTTPNWVNIDHRRGVSIAPGEMSAWVSAARNLGSDLSVFIESVHRLNGLGAAVTHVAHETSQDGFRAEWRVINVQTVSGDLIDRLEMFDETDVGRALARFDQLTAPAPKLGNAASQTARFFAYFAARDWDSIAATLAENVYHDDRRHVVNAGVLHGRDAQIANLRAIAQVGVASFSSTVNATRGTHLALVHTRSSGDQATERSLTEELGVVEINSDNRMAAFVAFDVDDFDAAIAELDARYLAGEAAAHSRIWSLVTEAFVALNQRRIPATTPDWANIDHRRPAPIDAGDLGAFLVATWELSPQARIYVAAVHRLSSIGAVITHVAVGTSPDGFDAEWRVVDFVTFEGDLIDRTELFDESDLNAALARFDAIRAPSRQLENAASRVTERFVALYAARDWVTMAETLADDFVSNDPRRVVGAGVRNGRDAQIADMRAIADLGLTNMTSTPLAIRGERLVLLRACMHFSATDQGPSLTNLLAIVEINTDGRMVALESFDADDFDAAIAELDARYVAGEAAAYADTWAVVTGVHAMFNRHELPPEDWVTIDHRRGTPFAANEMTPAIHTLFDLTPDFHVHIDTVHRLSSFGALITNNAHGSSPDGLGVEWRMVMLLIVDGGRLTRCEVFDENDSDAALTRFEELRPEAPRLENRASRAVEQFLAHFAARDWNAMANLIDEDFRSDDRRRGINAGIRHGRDVEMANWHATAEVWKSDARAAVVATRGQGLVLFRFTFASQDSLPAAFQAAALSVVQVNDDNRCAAVVIFDPDDLETAFEELETRYLAGEAAAHAHTWSTLVRDFTAFNEHKLPLTTPDWVNLDHRRGRAFSSGELVPYIHATWQLTPQAKIHVVAVHRLSNLGAVVTQSTHGTSPDGFDAEWLEVTLVTVDGDLINRIEVFDEADLDAALARFEELRPQAPRSKNPVMERFLASFAARNWDAMAQVFAADYYNDDRRRVVNAGVRNGRDAAIEDIRVSADVGLLTNITAELIASRGGHLILVRFGASGRDHPAIQLDVLQVLEYNADEQITAAVLFDPEDIDLAFEELETRYLAGEAAAHAHTWSVIRQGYAALNRAEIPVTSDMVDVDRRSGAAMAPGDLIGYLRAAFDDTAFNALYVEVVHRLTHGGAVVTHVAKGTSRGGFDAEWRMIVVITVEGDVISRGELFDETDLDAALVRFAELQPQPHRQENAASQVVERFWTCLTTRDWTAMAETMAGDFSSHDHRKVVNAGVLRGRDANIANMRAVAEVGFEGLTSTVVGTRGQRLVLNRIRSSAHGFNAGEISADMLGVLEIDADNRFTAGAIFDFDDIDAAFAELDARYLAGEAAAHEHTWSRMQRTYAALNRHEIPTTAPDFVNVDHRRGITFEPGEIVPYVQATWDVAPDLKMFIETVHRLTDTGCVVTHTACGTSQEGFDAEWRETVFFTFDGDLIKRCEMFDQTDVDAALARFDELHRPVRWLENAASRAEHQLFAHSAARDWAAVAETLAGNSYVDDRRRVVNVGMWDGRDVVIANMRALEEGLAHVTLAVIATRGERLALIRIRSFSPDPQRGEFAVEMLGIAEIDSDGRIAAHVFFDLDDIDTAFDELEIRYLSGEGAAHAHVWSVITRECAAFNRHELPTADWVTVDHRRLVTIDASDLLPNIRATWDLMPDIRVYIESVHRVSSLGAVVTYTATGTAHEGFVAEWRMIHLLTVEGDRINRSELFDEPDIDAALVRFEELQPQARRLENAASRVIELFWSYFLARNWDSMAQVLTDDSFVDDHRRTVNAGLWRGRDAVVTNMRALSEPGLDITLTVMATRGERLALYRESTRDLGHKEFGVELLTIVDINADAKIAAHIAFDVDDVDTAFEELDARYLAGEAAAHAHTWSVITAGYAALNRHELPAAAPDYVIVERQLHATIEAADLSKNLGAAWDLTPDLKGYVEAVHRLSDRAAVLTHVAEGTSNEGLHAEWRGVHLLTLESGMVDRCEMFDEADLDAAIARFDELHMQARQLENAASRVDGRLIAYFNAHDWAAMAETMLDDFCSEDRRHVVNAGRTQGREVAIANFRATAELGVTLDKSDLVATRGERLVLSRARWSGADQGPDAFHSEVLNVVEINTDERIVGHVMFDPDDVHAAIAELDARYLAGEAAAHAHTWSVIARAYAGFNRHELPATTADWVMVDRRPLVTSETVDLAASIRGIWDVIPSINIYVEAVHRLSKLGAVVTQTLKGTSHEGFDAEWRMIDIYTVDGDLLSRSELFDEANLDTALARFDELTGKDQPK